MLQFLFFKEIEHYTSDICLLCIFSQFPSSLTSEDTILNLKFLNSHPRFHAIVTCCISVAEVGQLAYRLYWNTAMRIHGYCCSRATVFLVFWTCHHLLTTFNTSHHPFISVGLGKGKLSFQTFRLNCLKTDCSQCF